MSAITAASIEYSEPFVMKLTDALFTITKISVPATTEEYAEGGIELLPEKLGLTVGLVTGTQATAGAHAEKFGAIWSDGTLALDKEQYEEGKVVGEAWACAVTTLSGKPFLRIYSQVTAGEAKPSIEPKTAKKVKLAKFSTVIFAIGK